MLSPGPCVFLCQRICCQKWRCSRRSGCSPSSGEVCSSWSWGGTRKPCWTSSMVCRFHQVRASFWRGTKAISTSLSWAALLYSAERSYALDHAYLDVTDYSRATSNVTYLRCFSGAWSAAWRSRPNLLSEEYIRTLPTTCALRQLGRFSSSCPNPSLVQPAFSQRGSPFPEQSSWGLTSS